MVPVPSRSSTEDKVVVLSGPVCAGKTTLASGLRVLMSARVLSTRKLIAELAPVIGEAHRRELQELGERLDLEHAGAWVAEAVRDGLRGSGGVVVVDAVRTEAQIAAVRDVAHTVHVHLTAPDEILAERYSRLRAASPDELSSLAAVRESTTESSIERLSAQADVTLDTSRLNIERTRGRAIQALPKR